MTEPLLKVEDVCQLIQCAKTTVYDLAKSGKLPSVRIGRMTRFHRSAVDAFIASCEQGQAPATKPVAVYRPKMLKAR